MNAVVGEKEHDSQDIVLALVQGRSDYATPLVLVRIQPVHAESILITIEVIYQQLSKKRLIDIRLEDSKGSYWILVSQRPAVCQVDNTTSGLEKLLHPQHCLVLFFSVNFSQTALCPFKGTESAFTQLTT